MQTKIPDIYHFNPTCEYAIANGTATWQPNLLLQKMESDLALLPVYLAEPADYIITKNTPSEKFIKLLNSIGIICPKILTESERTRFSEFDKNIDQLRPWGWSPAEHRFLSSLKKHCSEAFQQSPVFNWKPEHKSLYSKKFALQTLHKLLLKIDSPDLMDNNLASQICTSKTEIECLLNKWENLMIKAPWSSSGRGLQPITKVPVHTKVWEKILSTIKYQGYVLVEPLLNKAFDLAFQFELKKGKINYLGQSNFLTDKKGQYLGNHLNGLPQDLDPKIKEFISTIPGTLITPLINILEESELALHYEGNFGVDTLIFWDEDKKLRINPCLEINIRQNMGLLALQFEKLIFPETKGLYRTFYNPQKPFFEFACEMRDKFPLKISNQKIHAGFFPLTDYDENTRFGAYILVE